jgi:predicted dehydrogenase
LPLKNALDSGKLGNVYSLQLNCFWNRNQDYYQNSWKGTKLLDGGTLFTQFSHFIDLLYWMFGDVEMVKAITSNVAHKNLVEFEDNGAVLLQFENGIICSIHFTINAYKKNMEGSLTVFAEKGTVKIGGQYLNTLEYESMEGASLGPLPPGKPSNEYGSYQGSMSNHDKVYANLLDIINDNGTPGTTTLEALKTVEIISRIYQEAKTN